MKPLIALIAAALIVANIAKAQIPMPNGYKEVTYESDIPGASQHVSNGRYEFSLYPRARDMSSDDPEQSLKEGLELTFQDTKYAKTSDGLYVGTGLNKSGLYYYTIYIPEIWQQVTLTSKFNDKGFSENSSWILKQVRLHRKNVYFSKPGR